ncbi:MAG: glycosyltransferase family 2 protein [Actinomycetota bacterium]
MPDRPSADRGERLIMALKVRDEGDILEANLRFHHALGVDHFVVTDNGSTDETPQILRRYVDAGLAHVINDPDADLRERGAEWLTRMARLAATDLGADWVIHTDADEFWLPLRGTLTDALAAIPERYGVVVAPRTEFVGRPDGAGSFAERLTVRESRARLQPKVAHRADPDVVVLERGGHDVAVAGADGDPAGTLRPPGRPVHRGVRDAEGNDSARRVDENRLVWAPRWPVRILHFPVRSFAEFKRRIEIAIFENRFPDRGRFRRLRAQFEEGRLEELYAELVWDDPALEAGIRDGQLMRDERFARLLPECPDPLSGAPPGSVRVESEPDEVQREEAELEFDAMQLLSRTERWLIVQRERYRERNEALQSRKMRVAGQRDNARRRVETVRQRLRAERARPWSRIRRVAGRFLGR